MPLSPVAQLLLQIAVVLAAARLVGLAFRRVGQPQVVGEMVAGILLGPSLFGWAAPGAAAWVFPAASLPALGTLSQTGLVLFMFIVGLELDPKLLRGRGHAAILTSHASIVVPFVLGAALALHLYGHLSDASVSFTAFALFLGAAMSVTAFPVLARILTERNLGGTRVGALTLACAAVDDVTAWCLLAGVIAITRADGPWGVVATLGAASAYVAAMAFGARPLLARLEAYFVSRGRMTQDLLAVVLLLLLASALVTEAIGIHALFGAFLLGAVMPKDRAFVAALSVRVEALTVTFLLPIFFAFTGLRTEIGLLDSTRLWLDAALVLAVAVVGKFAGSALAARAAGLEWREAGALGILMNTRGLMELVFLTIGLELGVISPAVFAMMVLMALVTTFMTTPILNRILPPEAIRRDAAAEGAFTVVVPVSLPSSGPALLAAASALAPPGAARLFALHVRRADEGAFFERPGEAPDPLGPLLAAATARGVDVRPLAFVAQDVGASIAEVAEQRGADLVLMGWHQPVLSESLLSGTVYDVFRRTRADVAILVARTFEPWTRVLVPYAGGAHDGAALALARRIAANGVETTLLRVEPTSGAAVALADVPGADGLPVKIVRADDAVEAVAREAREGNYSLVVVGASSRWGLEPALFSRRHERLARACPASLLIVRKGTA